MLLKDDMDAILAMPFKDREKLLLMTLKHHKNPDSGLCCPSEKLLMQEMGMSRSSLHRVKRSLESKRVIETQIWQDKQGKHDKCLLFFGDRGEQFASKPSDFKELDTMSYAGGTEVVRSLYSGGTEVAQNQEGGSTENLGVVGVGPQGTQRGSTGNLSQGPQGTLQNVTFSPQQVRNEQVAGEGQRGNSKGLNSKREKQSVAELQSRAKNQTHSTVAFQSNAKSQTLVEDIVGFIEGKKHKTKGAFNKVRSLVSDPRTASGICYALRFPTVVMQLRNAQTPVNLLVNSVKPNNPYLSEWVQKAEERMKKAGFPLPPRDAVPPMAAELPPGTCHICFGAGCNRCEVEQLEELT